MEQERAQGEASRHAAAAMAAERDRLLARIEAAEAANVRLRGEAEAATRAKADFMARMTHEMRTPLSAIIGLANLALPLAGDPRVADYLAKITTSATGLLDVVDDITDFARLEKGLADLVVAPFDLAASLDRVAARFADTAHGKGLSLSVRLDRDAPPRLVGDSARLEGVLAQLVGNAVKFTEKGSVEITVRLVSREAGAVRLAFAVRDTGIGMDAATIPAMLESFTQADGTLSRPYGGTGLGLALVRRGAVLLGGDLEVTSLPGQGSRFAFEALFVEDTGEDATAPVPPPPAATPAAGTDTAKPLAGTLILLVEDNAINRQVARDTLQRFGASVDVARHGGEAVEMVKVAFYDAVLMDVQMPVMDGLTATRLIRALPGGPDLPIVALTAHALAEDRDRCLEAGMNDYLTKPIDTGRLLNALGQWIAPAAAAAKAGRLTIASGQEPGRKPAAGRPGPDSGLDAATALARLGGNERLLLSVATEFSRDYKNSARILARHIEAGDLGEARRLAHTIKGVAGNIAADVLAEAARGLEARLASGQAPSPPALAAFTAALEATLAAASRLAPPAAVPQACAQDGCWRILLVDDAKLNRAIFSQILRSAGHDVATAANGKEACRALFGEKATGRPYDLILMDIEMPEMDGPAATRVIRGLLSASASPPCPPGIPIVALTSHDADGERARCLEAGMDECLPKLFEHDALLDSLAQVMRGRDPRIRRPDSPRPAGGAGTAMGPLLRCLAGHLAEGNIRADEDMAVLREAFSGRPAPMELEALSQAIERYDFAGALAVASRLAPLLGVDPAGLPGRSRTGGKAG
ncbi:Hpt sensor hybrid histidine kinase [Solidesulfovibrio carbinoliphilus subsp. oakridgensis]|uniref:histidine kinase n=1 Tax=Solidesulfovibrio carbinoliphilus subsp. oakridgensis TaxID=694327 RepID=G7Q7X3_9BACT|nr:response regulator [Solidesulfovibrio carbinoliphilus]EHJ47667.1 Hpt sensor hybrid histidine kinase [Solidesulfovibrio carbinoliphilus subsp. oakridgensis]